MRVGNPACTNKAGVRAPWPARSWRVARETQQNSQQGGRLTTGKRNDISIEKMDYNEPTDPEVPVLRGNGGWDEVKMWANKCKAYYSSLKKEERSGGQAGHRIRLNLRGGAQRLAEDFDVGSLNVDEDDVDSKGDPVPKVKDAGVGKGYRRLVRFFRHPPVDLTRSRLVPCPRSRGSAAIFGYASCYMVAFGSWRALLDGADLFRFLQHRSAINEDVTQARGPYA